MTKLYPCIPFIDFKCDQQQNNTVDFGVYVISHLDATGT
jgi:hypothetical protein